MKPLLQAIWKSDRKAFLTILLWNIGVSILSGVGIVMLIPLLNMLEIGDNRLPDWFMTLGYPLQVGLLLVGYVLLVTVKTLLSRSLSIRENAFIEETGMALREKLYAVLSGASWESLTARKDADVINLFTSQCGQVSYGIAEVIHFLASIVSAAVQLGIALMMSLPVTALVYLVCTLGLKVETDRLVVLVYVFARLWPVFSGFQGRIQSINSCVPAYEKLIEALREMQPETDVAETDEDFSRWREIRFDNVHFAYRNSDEETLRGVSFSLERGEKLALLGRNGAGKTTAVNLLLGFLLPQSGAILVDGKPLEAACIRAWRTQVGYVPQDPLILNASVRENLTRFHPNATEDELIAALRKAIAWGFVSRLPDGLDTVLGDRGVRLSGGERQRIVLARVLLGHPSLIVLDEATSALDYESEMAFHDAIASFGKDAAVVLIAHHGATIAMADSAVVLEKGSVVEQGLINELAGRDGGYLSGMTGQR